MKLTIHLSSAEIGNPALLHHDFELHEKADWLAINAKQPAGQWMYLHLIDPDGHIRMQYLCKNDEFALVVGPEADLCSCGSVPGEIPPGTWTVRLAGQWNKPWTCELELAAMTGEPERQSTIGCGESVWWTKQTALADASAASLPYTSYDWNRPTKIGERWYKGDFHMHTRLSDGKQTARLLNASAVSQGLDFIAITEHNIVTTGWPETELLVIPGVEMTGSKGHYNALGIREWVQLWDGDGNESSLETDQGMERILKQSRNCGAVNSLNHPLLAPWDWQLGDIRLELFDVMEIWNDPTFPDNPEATEKALKAWDLMWQNGVLVWAIGGSDTHLLPHESYTEGGEPSLVGDPATFVWTDRCSASAILQAIRSGHSYVTRGPELEPKLLCGGQTYRPGDKVASPVGDSGTASFLYELEIHNAPFGSVVHWIENGELREIQASDPNSVCRLESTWAHNRFQWIRAEIRDAEGRLLAFVNPVYSGETSRRLTYWSEVLERLKR